MYILVRQDLPSSVRSVQAGHALAEYLLHYKSLGWSNGTLVYLGVPNEESLIKWENELRSSNIDYSMFREPDFDGQATALAVLGKSDKFRKFRKLRLSK